MTLLDTHALIWATADPAKLSRAATEAIRKASREGGIAIAAITLWELAWLASHQRLQITGTVEAYLAEINPADSRTGQSIPRQLPQRPVRPPDRRHRSGRSHPLGDQGRPHPPLPPNQHRLVTLRPVSALQGYLRLKGFRIKSVRPNTKRPGEQLRGAKTKGLLAAGSAYRCGGFAGGGCAAGFCVAGLGVVPEAGAPPFTGYA